MNFIIKLFIQCHHQAGRVRIKSSIAFMFGNRTEQITNVNAFKTNKTKQREEERNKIKNIVFELKPSI